MLSLGTTYAANLVFKYGKKPNEDVECFKLTKIRWKMEDLCIYSMHSAELTSDDWYKIKMFSFINHGPNVDFDVLLEELSYFDLSYFEDHTKSDLLIQGIEFQPIEMIQPEDLMDDGAYWEKKLPKDYQHYIQMSEKPLQYAKKKELYLLFCAGFLSYNGLWFSLCKSTSGICSMLPATHILRDDGDYCRLDTLIMSESRFTKVKKLINARHFYFKCNLQSTGFSPEYSYACYLVFKFVDNNFHPEDTEWESKYVLDANEGVVFLYSNFHRANTPNFNFHQVMNIPTIKTKNDYGLQDLSNTTEITGPKIPVGYTKNRVHSWMGQREDGWMEVMLCSSLLELQYHELLKVKLRNIKGGFKEIIVEGMEFRPMQSKIN